MDRIGLADTIAALRAELEEAMAGRGDGSVEFPVERVQLEFNVRVERAVDARGGVRFWVVELGSAATVAREEIQRITVSLGPPIRDGQAVPVTRHADERP